MSNLLLRVLEETFVVCQLPLDYELPLSSLQGEFVSITRTSDELSLVCNANNVPPNAKCESGWRCLKVEGVLEFSLVGILSRLSTVLAEAGISIFAVSTFNTDYLLVKSESLGDAVSALRKAGIRV